MRVAVCPGSFDPVTEGHLDIVRRAAEIFDRVYVCAMVNDRKGAGLLTKEQRLRLLQLAVADLENVTADSWDGWMVDYAKKVGAKSVVKGVRSAEDLPWELELAEFNRNYDPEFPVETVLLAANKQYQDISSTLVRDLLQRGEDITHLVPASVAGLLKQWKGR